MSDISENVLNTKKFVDEKIINSQKCNRSKFAEMSQITEMKMLTKLNNIFMLK